MIRLALIIAAAGALVAPAPAGAVEIRSSSPSLQASVEIAAGFSYVRGVTPRADTIVSLAERPCGRDAAGCVADGLGGRLVEIRASMVREADRETRRRARGGTGGDSVREQVCATVAHELWHTAGIEHTETGLMAEGTATVTPWPCRSWRAQLDRAAIAKRGRR